jgi:hypothetical protein
MNADASLTEKNWYLGIILAIFDCTSGLEAFMFMEPYRYRSILFERRCTYRLQYPGMPKLQVAMTRLRDITQVTIFCPRSVQPPNEVVVQILRSRMYNPEAFIQQTQTSSAVRCCGLSLILPAKA